MRTSDKTETVPAVEIVVNGRFAPHTLVLAPGRRHRLVFLREETDACSARVVLPSLGQSVDLPPFEKVAVELPELPPGSYPITCQRGVLYGRIIVRERRRRVSARGGAVV